ncbi:hypothetical protein VT84_22530 [Gemmata sp. SH-PL17]|uniref:hypothetical protein n=1 Tax=Gemmata sp. SH-PL17 TaxID=1630693 RepID=UPI0006971B5F|nr:hypothetical protein [Gemmata sp. SH-PL17]AMV27195.1 hypothetical protein VT84_22530 [Gemmata sp. SH-PL17]
MRRRLIVMSLIALAGCNRFAGPRETRQLDRADGRAPDGTRYSIDEQKIRGRERLSISEDDFRIGPKGFIDRPSPTGR